MTFICEKFIFICHLYVSPRVIYMNVILMYETILINQNLARNTVLRVDPPPLTHNREPYALRHTLLSDTIATDPSVEPMPLSSTRSMRMNVSLRGSALADGPCVLTPSTKLCSRLGHRARTS